MVKFLSLLMLSLSSLMAAPAVVFAPLPMKDAESVYKHFAPLVAYMEDALEVEIAYHISESYKEIYDGLSEGTIDMAYLGPLPYVVLKQRHDFLEPLVFFNEPSGEPFYSCAIVAWNPAERSLERMSPKGTFALTSPLSTCGALSVEAMLTRSQQSLREHTSKFLGKHDAVALSVVRGEFDYGGVKESIGRAYEHLGLEVIALTPPLPGFALVVNTQKLSPTKQDALKKALLGVSKETMKHWGNAISHGAVEAHDEDYRPVRSLLRDTSFWNAAP